MEHLKMNETKVTGRLEKWSYDPTNHMFWGRVYGDSKGRFADGTYIHTSMCHKPDAKEGDIIKTHYSTYLLGEKYDPEVHGL